MPTQVDDELDQDELKKPVGKPLPYPYQGPQQPPASAAIGQPLKPPTMPAAPVTTTGTMAPPEVPQQPIAGAPDSIGTPLQPPTAQGSAEAVNANNRLAQSMAPAHRSAIGKVLNAIGMSTNIGRDVEAGAGIGTIGRQMKQEEARQNVEDVNNQIAEGEKERQATAAVGEAGARQQASEAQTEAEKRGAELVDFTLPDGSKTQIMRKNLATPTTALVTGASRENVAKTNATARENLQAGKPMTMDQLAAQATQEGDQETLTKIEGYEEAIAEAGKQEPGNFMPVNDAQGNILGWADPKSRDWVPASAVGGAATGAGGVIPSKVAADAGAKNTAAVAELGLSAQAAYKRLEALAGDDSDPSNYAFLMSFIGMSYEAIKGARLNQAEITRAIATRTLPDQLQHMYDLYIQKRILTPEQKQEMLKTAKIIAGTYGDNTGEASKPSATGGGAGSTPSGHKIGDTVTIKGKTMKITVVHPDNSFDAK